MRICKAFSFDSAHQLPNHHGKCKSIHGHTYHMEVEVSGKIKAQTGETDEGMVMDFGEVKSIVKEHVVDPMDHAFLVCGDEPLFEEAQKKKEKIYHLGFRSTAENMVAHIWEILQPEFAKKGVSLQRVRLNETVGSWAEVREGDL